MSWFQRQRTPSFVESIEDDLEFFLVVLAIEFLQETDEILLASEVFAQQDRVDAERLAVGIEHVLSWLLHHLDLFASKVHLPSLVEVDVEQVIKVRPIEPSEQDQGAADEASTVTSSSLGILCSSDLPHKTGSQVNCHQIIPVLVGPPPEDKQFSVVVVESMPPPAGDVPLQFHLLPFEGVSLVVAD